MTYIEDQKFIWIGKNLIKEGYLGRISGNATKVYLSLMTYSHNDTGLAFPSMATICNDTGIKKKQTIRAALDELIANGIIKQVSTGGANQSNRYIVADGKEVRPYGALVPPNVARQDKIVKRESRKIDDAKRKRGMRVETPEEEEIEDFCVFTRLAETIAGMTEQYEMEEIVEVIEMLDVEFQEAKPYWEVHALLRLTNTKLEQYDISYYDSLFHFLNHLCNNISPGTMWNQAAD